MEIGVGGWGLWSITITVDTDTGTVVGEWGGSMAANGRGTRTDGRRACAPHIVMFQTLTGMPVLLQRVHQSAASSQCKPTVGPATATGPAGRLRAIARFWQISWTVTSTEHQRRNRAASVMSVNSSGRFESDSRDRRRYQSSRLISRFPCRFPRAVVAWPFRADYK